MNRIGLGTVYKIPTKSSSGFIPDSTLSMDIPVAAITNEAMQTAYPISLMAATRDVPAFLERTWPSFEAKAIQSMPMLVEAAWPAIEQKLVQRSSVISKQVFDDAVPAKTRILAVVGVAAVVAGVGYLLLRKRK